MGVCQYLCDACGDECLSSACQYLRQSVHLCVFACACT